MIWMVHSNHQIANQYVTCDILTMDTIIKLHVAIYRTTHYSSA